jgi:type I restriction enzyme R subunit
MPKEAQARIKINKLLEEAGWRFFDSVDGKANIVLEPSVKITKRNLSNLGDDFANVKTGFIDFLLLDEKGFPFIVLEAKAENKNPLFGKEQARQYAQSQHCRFIILSNGNSHYFWDLERGNPQVIYRFPSPDLAAGLSSFTPNREALANETVADDYIVLTKKPDYKTDPSWLDEKSRPDFIKTYKLRFLRPYQVKAITAIQKAVKEGKDRFLFEMATGTGKTLVAAAIIKLFKRTGNAQRILFLVDRLELEQQASDNFKDYLKGDYISVIYKENRDDWRKADIVVSTIQTFLSNNRYKRSFAPNDFELVISDEAHRSISGNSRAVFEYFIGYKLGLTATPKDYLKSFDATGLNVALVSAQDPRELERRTLLDTYKTFGCETGEPTFRYSLLDGVRDGYLINPIVADARTEITAQLLSEHGYAVIIQDKEGNEAEEVFVSKEFEKKFFSDNTNRAFCKVFLDNALRDPITGEIGKTIIFCVKQDHAAKIADILCQYADEMFPGKYQSNFAMQVTSSINGAQEYTVQFSNNRLSGSSNFEPSYKTSKTRVCVTVGMMTTGYDCTDLLNICLMRPIFSPSDFIQIKGRGTRKHNFTDEMIDLVIKEKLGDRQKTKFKIFDFFANCEYFEEKYNYDEVLSLPKENNKDIFEVYDKPLGPFDIDGYYSSREDNVSSFSQTEIGPDGMKIDRMYFDRFEQTLLNDPKIDELKEQAQAGLWDSLLDFVIKNIFDKPEDYFNVEKLRAALNADRRIQLKEMLEKVLGLIPRFKTKEELLEEEFDKFDSRYMPGENYFADAKTIFKAYIEDTEFRNIVDQKNLAQLNVTPWIDAYRQLNPELRKLIPEYIKDYVPLNNFVE